MKKLLVLALPLLLALFVLPQQSFAAISCQSNSDCSSGQTCLSDGTCGYAAGSPAANCLDTCSGTCNIDANGNATCSTGNSTGSTQKDCSYPKCSADYDCNASESCVGATGAACSGTCHVTQASGGGQCTYPSCTTNADCNSGETCTGSSFNGTNGACSGTCRSSDTGSSGTGYGLGSSCDPSAGAATQCTSSTYCSPNAANPSTGTCVPYSGTGGSTGGPGTGLGGGNGLGSGSGASGSGINFYYLNIYKNGITGIINGIIVPILLAIAFFVFIYGVFKYFIQGAAEEESRTEGRQFVMWGVIGFAIIFSVWGLVAIVLTTAGLGAGGASGTQGLTAPTL